MYVCLYVCMYVCVCIYVCIHVVYIYIYAHVHSCQCAHRKDRPALLFGKVALVDAPKMTWSSQAAVVPSSSTKTEVDEFDLKSYGSRGWLVTWLWFNPGVCGLEPLCVEGDWHVGF